jgi:hypothetical protein
MRWLFLALIPLLFMACAPTENVTAIKENAYKQGYDEGYQVGLKLNQSTSPPLFQGESTKSPLLSNGQEQDCSSCYEKGWYAGQKSVLDSQYTEHGVTYTPFQPPYPGYQP